MSEQSIEMNRRNLKDGAIAGALLTTALTAILYFISQLSGIPYIPYQFCIWLVEALPGTLSISAFAVLIGGLLYFDIDVNLHLVTVGQVVAVLLFILMGTACGLLLPYILGRKSSEQRWFRHSLGLLIGGIFGLMAGSILIPAMSANQRLIVPTNFFHWLATLGSYLAFLVWGYFLQDAYVRTNRADASAATTVTNRRVLMSALGGMAALVTVLSGGTGAFIARFKRQQKMAAIDAAMHTPASFPAELHARVYPTQPKHHFVEQQYSRYQPATHPFGVAISGGGVRSFSAAIGQLRGLMSLDLLDAVGAISAVSGGAWFSTLFSYAPLAADDSTLLGPILRPEELTLDNLRVLPPGFIGAALPNFTNNRIFALKSELMLSNSLAQQAMFNRIYGRMLNELLLAPLGLDDPRKFFTLDASSVNAILRRNPQLTADDFYTTRPNRPYLIVNATQIYPIGINQWLRHFEFTPLYSGMPQLFPGAGPNGSDIGGGYVESFAFDSKNPGQAHHDGTVAVPTPDPIFLLADILGATSAAPGVILASLEEPEWFPRFMQWPLSAPTGQESHTYSFVDGDALENLGIVPLLRRQYPVILVFANLQQPIGASGPRAVDGIDRHISRLFGFKPEDPELNIQDTQIFPAEKFADLVHALKTAKARGEPTVYVDSYPIIQPNAFDIPSYPAQGGNSGEVTVVWFYNDINPMWQAELSPELQTLLASTDSANFLANFPNYQTVNQNSSLAGIPQLLQLTPTQINLLAHMWSYTVVESGGEMLQKLRAKYL